MVSSIVRRLRVLDPHLLEILAHGPLESARIVNIYAIMKTDRLFREFMVEVYLPKPDWLRELSLRQMSGGSWMRRQSRAILWRHGARI